MDIDGSIYCPKCMRQLAETDPDVSVCPFCGREPKTLRPSAALDTGTLLAGRYQLGDVIGRGGFGITYAAWDETLGMPVAVKEFFPREDAVRDTEISDEVKPLPERETGYADGLNRFRRESHMLASLQGIPCVVKVLDYFSENGTAYIVMEFVHGKPVDRWVRENNIKPSGLPALLRPVFDALVRTHSQGVIHRDITPDNLLVEEDGSLKLIDFGSAVEVSRSAGTVMLTRQYAPVEQYGRDYGRQGPWTDVYSLAAVMYTLFSGQEPVESPLRAHHDEQKPLSRMHTGLKRRRAAAVDRALTVSPEKRTQSMAEFRASFYNLPMPEEVKRRKRFMRRVIAAVSVLLVLLSLVALNFTTGLPVGSGLLGSVRSNGIHIVNRLRDREEVSIPERVLGIQVSEIGADAFRGDGTLRRAEIPGTVREIGDSAFYGCDRLEEVVLAEGVESVGMSAFGGCVSLLSLSLPDSLTRIGDGAIPAQAPLMTVWGSRGTETERYADGNGLRFADASELAWEIRDGTAVITSVASDARRLTLPNTVEGVPVTAIAEGIRLTKQEEVWLPEYLETVTPELFYKDQIDGSRLQRVRMGSHVREIGDMAFKNCYLLEKPELPDTLERIGNEAFCYAGLRELTLPDGLREIGEKALAGTWLTRLTVPSGVERIGNGAFLNMSELAEIEFRNDVQVIPESLLYSANTPTVVLPETVTAIEDSAFAYSALQWIALPDGVRTIGCYAFANCDELRFVLIPSGVQEIDENAFEGFAADMVIAGHAGTAAEAFAHRKRIPFEDVDKWTVPDYFRNGEAVYDNTRTERLVRVPWYNPEDNCLISGCVFSGNTDTGEVILSRYQTEIGTRTFSGMTGLRSVSSPGEIRRIGGAAFAGCSALESAPLKDAEKIESGAFQDCSALTDISLENARVIEMNAFENCGALREVRLSDRLVRIGMSTFASCGVLREIRLPDSLLEIGMSAFQHCSSLRYIILPGNLLELGSYALAECGELQLAVFREGVTGEAVNQGAFRLGTALETVYLPSTVTRFNAPEWEACCGSLREIWLFNPAAEIDSFSSSEELPPWTVHGYTGSTAEKWAKENGLQFEPIPAGTAMPDPSEIAASYDF